MKISHRCIPSDHSRVKDTQCQSVYKSIGFSGLHSVSRSWADHTSWCRFKNEHHAWFRSGGWSASWSCRTLWSWKPSPECEIVLYTYGYIFALNWALIMSRKSPINVKRW